MTSYEVCRRLEENSIPHWRNLLEKLPSVYKVWFQDNITIQKQEHWDLFIVFLGSQTPLRIDIKTRSPNYHQLFKKDGLVLIEINGNTSGDVGSSIYNSNADLWGYGFLVGDRIVDPLIFWRKPFAEWLSKVESAFINPRNSNTDNLYETQNILIPKVFFNPFLFRC